jgi:hypothetical protein
MASTPVLIHLCSELPQEDDKDKPSYLIPTKGNLLFALDFAPVKPHFSLMIFVNSISSSRLETILVNPALCQSRGHAPHNFVSCLIESLSRLSGPGNVPPAPEDLDPIPELDPCVPLALLFVLPPALLDEPPAEFAETVRCCNVALISQCSCIRMLLMAALVCNISSLTR